ncbi:UDP-N-acetylglucosamine-N-acetylmuramyl-(pentapeptide) pyrophosphoryl-undecaprenol N-acetylglucosamine transferase [candidate division SR1 bacterium RAAC1_SR1_1]|nr:UDP-N-acetylglucosamine-N-acetylmuramyl-(pentapeptide) pyrophosphoryl-undecaprenol N-acetylglucosamine transferase [candidate division SR1 bacterium RAAC1_SR1_1]
MKQKPLKIVMAGGGTGGHVFPIKSLLEYLAQHKTFSSNINHIYRFGNKNALEYTVFQGLKNAHNGKKKGYELDFISIYSGKYRRETLLKSRIKNVRDLFLFAIGVVQSLFWLIYYKIDVIFCKGGYIALPVVAAARLLRKKIIVHESDTHSGLVNKIASKFAWTTFTGFDNVLPKAKTVGQIISEEVIIDQKEAKMFLKQYPELDVQKPWILVVGGSQGSQRLYQAIIKALESDKSLQNDIQFLVVLGLLNKDLRPQFERFPNVVCFDFVTQKEMGMLCYHSDIAITRAGTTSLAEQKLYDMKLFIVPIAWTHDQYDNANRYQKHYNDILIDQKDDTFLNKLIMEIKRHKNFKKILTSQDRLATISKAKEEIWEHIID